jgi:bacterial/archaeal transporter family protein
MVHLGVALGRLCGVDCHPLAKVGVGGVNSNVATAIRTTVILFFTWAIAFATARDAIFVTISRRAWSF